MAFFAFATFILQATVVLGLAIGLRYLLRDKISAASRYRLVFVTVACFPLLAAAAVYEVRPSILPIPADDHSLVADGSSAEGISAFPAPKSRAARIKVPTRVADALLAAWGVIGLALALRSLAARFRIAVELRSMSFCRDPAWLAALDAAAARYGIRRKIRLLDGGRHPPFTAGFLGGTIVVPASDHRLGRIQREGILFHEAAHVKRADVLAMTFIELVAAAAWCVPFMPHALRALIQDREEACDILAVGSGASPSDYASLVLELAASRPLRFFGAATGMVGRTRIEERIRRITDPDLLKVDNRLLGRAALVLILLSGTSVCGTGMLSKVFAFEAAAPASSATIAAEDGEGGREYPLSSLPAASPLVGSWKVTLPFGKQRHPITSEPYLHVGIDLANGRSGDPVYATMEGRVTAAGYDDRDGNYVAIGDDRLLVRFTKLRDTSVAVGDRVRIGEKIGAVGATGIATGPHLHYEVWIDGKATDPAVALRAGGANYAGLFAE